MKYLRKVINGLNHLRLNLFCKNIKFKGVGLVATNASVQVIKGQLKAGKRMLLSTHAELRSYGDLQIGYNFCLNSYSRIIAHDKITIGNNVTLAQFVTILDHDHNYEVNLQGDLCLNGYKTAPISIGNNVWIADKVTILKGVTIGDNVIIGANSLVVKDVESNSIVGGVPAKLLKKI